MNSTETEFKELGFSDGGISVTLISITPVFLAILIGFSILQSREWNRAVYYGRCKLSEENPNPPPMPRGMFGWIGAGRTCTPNIAH
jgi:hypothetical protein